MAICALMFAAIGGEGMLVAATNLKVQVQARRVIRQSFFGKEEDKK